MVNKKWVLLTLANMCDSMYKINLFIFIKSGSDNMNITIVGCGKVGAALAAKLIDEGHNITVIDVNSERIQRITDELDVLGIVGNGSSNAILSEAATDKSDVFIAVTGSDELNLLCCLFAKKAGKCHAIARVRNPIYGTEIDFIRKQLGFSAIINPELATAREISRVLRVPAAMNVDAFADGRVYLVKFNYKDVEVLKDVPLKDFSDKLGCNVLICAVERGEEVIIPNGEFILHDGDVVTFVSTREKVIDFFKKLELPTKQVKNTLIVGGGTIGYYLAKDLIEHNIKVSIVEQNVNRCDELADLLPEATILHGDGTDKKLLLSEGLPNSEAFVPLTNLDEENVLLSLFAKKYSSGKIVTKINRLEFDDILENLDMGSVIYPKYLTCDFILQYIRALQNESGNNIKTLYHILHDSVEAIEFTVNEESDVTDIPLYKLKLKKNLLIGCITRGDKVIIPRGNDEIKVGDSVIVVTLQKGLNDIHDIAIR